MGKEIDVTSSSREELEQMLTGSYVIDEDEDEDTTDDEASDEEGDTSFEDEDEEEASDDEAQDTSEDSDDEVEQDEDEEEAPDVRALREQNDRLTRQLQDKEAMIQRQGNELGELRRMRSELVTAIREKKKEVDELEGVDTTAWYKEQKNLEALEQQAQRVTQREQVLQHNARAFELADKVAPPFEGMDDAIYEVLKRDGESDEGIKTFLANPGILGEAAPAYLIQVRKRAQAERLLAQAFQALQQVNSKGKAPKNVATPTPKRRIKSTDAASNLGRPPKITPDQIRTMSREELEKVLNKNRRR